jgi:hypothetical protein
MCRADHLIAVSSSSLPGKQGKTFLVHIDKTFEATQIVLVEHHSIFYYVNEMRNLC